jgi:hypothetical protein
MGDPIFRYYKRVFKDLEPVKDTISEMTEEEPKTIEEMKRRLSKKMKKKE